MLASPSISVFSDMPGPDVAVIAFLPANDAPTTAPMPAISSSACSMVPPYFQISRPRKCMISDDGVIGYPPKKSQPAAMAAAAHRSLPSTTNFGVGASGRAMVRAFFSGCSCAYSRPA